MELALGSRERRPRLGHALPHLIHGVGAGAQLRLGLLRLLLTLREPPLHGLHGCPGALPRGLRLIELALRDVAIPHEPAHSIQLARGLPVGALRPRHVRAHRLHGGTLGLEARPHLFHRRLAPPHRHERPLDRRARLVDLRARRLPRERDLAARGAEARLGGRHRRARLVASRLEVPRVDARQQIPLPDGLVVGHEQLNDVATDLPADGRDRALDVGVIGPDVGGGVAPRVARVAERREGRDDAEPDEDPPIHGARRRL
jgi:hypothetical protein